MISFLLCNPNYPILIATLQGVNILLGIYIMFSKGSPKKTVNFKDIGIKGGWVLVSKPNFFT